MIRITRSKSAFAVFLLGFALASCSKKQEVKPDESGGPSAPAADENVLGDSDSGKALGLQTVHFGYDSATLGDEAKRVLDDNARVLKEKSSVRIQIEGHCDSRGGIQYNIALGERRANAAKSYLSSKGISADRVSTISYGKERSIDPGTTEEAYAKNRRGNFVITSH